MRRALLLAALATSPAHADEPAHPLNAKVLRGIFGPQFVQLDAVPAEVVTDDEQKADLVSDLFLRCATDDGADDLDVADCRKRSAEIRARDPVYLELRTTADGIRYDSKRRGWALTFTDALQSGYGIYHNDVALSAWKPSMPERIERKKCDDGSDESRACYPLELPRTFKTLMLFVPMGESEARAWRASEDGGRAWLSFLVSIRQGTQWTKTWTRWFMPDEAKWPHEHRGVLVRVHAMSMKLGERSWSFPEWWAPPP